MEGTAEREARAKEQVRSCRRVAPPFARTSSYALLPLLLLQAKSYVRSLDELAAAGDEDSRRDVDRATYKARHFDDWKDGHPKGAGVTKRV